MVGSCAVMCGRCNSKGGGATASESTRILSARTSTPRGACASPTCAGNAVAQTRFSMSDTSLNTPPQVYADEEAFVVPPHFAAPGRCVGNALPRSLDHGSGPSRLRAPCPAYGQAVPLFLASGGSSCAALNTASHLPTALCSSAEATTRLRLRFHEL